MKAIIVDDHVLFREGFALLLNTLAPEIALEQASSCREACHLLSRQAYELVLLDWWLEQENGADAIDLLRAASPHARIVVLSGDKSPVLVNRAIGLGACGFIPKESSKAELTHALRTVLAGRIYLPVFTAPQQQLPQPVAPSLRECFPRLTARQVDVLRSALRGHSNKQIARELGISTATVSTHLMAIYGAMGVRNRTEAVFLAASRGAMIG